MTFKTFLAAALLLRVLQAAEPEPDPRELPRIPALSPVQGLASIKVKPGFKVELAAAEPEVMDPVAAAWDEKGRLYVVEMRDYSERRDERLGRVRVLEDLDGDGRYEKSTLFVDNLPWPTAIICYDGGVFIGATPDILYCKDTDGDGKADVRQVAFTGFGANVEKLNVQQLFNSFAWTLDNRIHGASGGNSGVITCPRRPADKPIELRGRDFSFDPKTLEMRLESGGGQYGLSFDNSGRKFVCSNSSHIIEVLYEDHYLTNNPWFLPPPPAVGIAVDGGAAEVYRISPDEPWRVLRTKWRVTGMVPGPIEGGGRPSGYFTGATGISIYRGDALPDDFQENAFTGDAGSNLVHRKKLSPNGIVLKAERPADEQRVEFLASKDNWFRPVQTMNGPDGGFYVIDMYREVIEHPWSLPQSIKKHLDLNSGNDRGRIYRVVPENFKRPANRQLNRAETAAIVKALESRNGWTRDTASRLLYEKQDRTAIPLLKDLAGKSAEPFARMHALYALGSLSALDEPALLSALADNAPVVRQHAIKLSEGTASPALRNKLFALASDPDLQVRYQLALSLSTLRSPDKNGALAALAAGNNDPWMSVAALLAANERPVELFAFIARKRMGESFPFLRQLAGIIGARNVPLDSAQLIDEISSLSAPKDKLSILNAFADSLSKSGSSLMNVGSSVRLTPFFVQARTAARTPAAETDLRVEGIHLLGHGDFASSGNLLSKLIVPEEPEQVQVAALSSLARFGSPQTTQILLQKWDSLTPALRRNATDFMLRRRDRQLAFLGAIKGGLIQRSEVSAAQLASLRNASDPEVRRMFSQAFGQARTASREEALAAMRPALSLKGDTGRGKKIFEERCATCHVLARVGHALGPDLATVKSSGKETILGNIVDPNREVAPRYLNYEVETKTGETFSGLIVSETANSIVLRRPNSDESSILRSNIVKLRGSGQSLMPEGLEAGLTPQDMADLLELIITSDPSP